MIIRLIQKIKLSRLSQLIHRAKIRLFHNFLFSILGRSDFPIAFAMISRETSVDIITFLTAVKQVTLHFNIFFPVNLIMIDAAPEEALAIKTVFPQATRLMCGFHMKKNIREPRNAGKVELKPVYESILKACDYFSTCAQIFEVRKKEVLEEWSVVKHVYLHHFSAQFSMQLILIGWH